ERPAQAPPAEEPTERPHRRSLVPKDPGDLFAGAAGGLTGLGLILTAVPYGRAGTVLFAGVGLVLGLLGLLAAEQRRRWTAIAAAASLAVLAVVCLAPSWLGLRPWWDTSSVDEIPAGQIRALSKSGKGASAAAGGDVDASQSVWQQDDVALT